MHASTFTPGRGLRRGWLAGLVCALGSAGATQVPPGPVSGVWTAAGSPYEVLGHIQVPAGQQLEVAEGATVVFQGPYRLTVQGTLSALGSSSRPVTWSGPARWQGLRFENTGLVSTLRHCRIENAEQGVASIDAPLDLEACLLAGHVTAVHVFGVGDSDPAAVRIAGCVIRDCQQHGIFVVENSHTEIIGCEVTRCALDGSPRGAVQLSNQSVPGGNDPVLTGNWIHHNTWQGLTAFDVTGGGRIRPQVTDNTIEYNYTGVYLLYASGVFRHNRINHNYQAGNPNSGAGVMISGAAARPVFTQNTTTGNYTGYYLVQGATANLGDLGNPDPDDDGGNLIFGNLDGSGHLWSVYNLSTADVTAENNAWDSDDPAVIAGTIHDRNDDPSVGLVDFDPFASTAAVAPLAPGAADPVPWRLSLQPNPCRGAVELVLSAPTGAAAGAPGRAPAAARLAVLDAAGRVVCELPCAAPALGGLRLGWDGLDAGGRPAPAGVYFCRLEVGGRPVAARALVMRR